MKKHTKALKITFNVITWTFVAFAVLVTIMVFAAQANSAGVPAIGGKCTINILSDSMKPEFKEGDLLISELLEDDEKRALAVGDVISFYADINNDGTNEINTHRITDIIRDGDRVVAYWTQGDNKEMSIVEESINCEDVIAVWTGTKLAGIGGFISFLSTSVGFFVVIILPLIAVFIYELVKFITAVLSVKNSGKKISAADEELIKQRAIEEYLRQKEAEKTAAEENKPSEE